MTPLARPNRVTVILMVALLSLAFGALLASALLKAPPVTAIPGLPASQALTRITAVPTFQQHRSSPIASQSSLMPATNNQPTLLASLSVDASAVPSAAVPLSFQSSDLPLIPGPLFDPTLALLAGPVDVPLEIRIPVLDIQAPVLGVGLTATNAMASPIGTYLEDPIWGTVFWYRGGDIPGEVGTATFAGHFDDDLGRPAVFAYLAELRRGDLIIVHDQRNGLEIPFIVTETTTYNDQEADPAVLSRIFGSRVVTGVEPLSGAEQLSRLTLITCGGVWDEGSFESRLVVYAERASYPS